MKRKFTYRPRIKNSVARNILGKILTLGILLNSIPINSLAGVLLEDGRYETFIDNNITVNDVLEEDNIDVKIEGNTLVNLVTKDAYDNGGLSLSAPFYNFETVYPLDTNKTYSLVVKGLEGIVDKLCLTDANGSISMGYRTYQDVMKFTPGYENNKRLYMKLLDGKTINDITNCNIMIFEGDLTSNPPTEYIKGIQSSFENNLVTQEMIDNGEEKQENLGKYKVEVKSTGKNLFKEWFNGYINPGNGKDLENDKALRTTFIPVDNNKSYFISGLYDECSSFVAYYDSNYNYISRNSGQPRNNLKLTASDIVTERPLDSIPNNCSFIRLTQYTTTLSEHITLHDIIENTKFIQIEEGSSATPHEPYKESINTFYLNSPLLEGDTIEYINGQATHIRRYNLATLNGGEDERYSDWRTTGNIPSEGSSVFILLDSSKTHLKDIYLNGYETDKMISNRFLQEKIVNGAGFIQYYINLHLSIKTDELPSQDELGFKKWLQSNPVTIIYRLNNPIYEPIKTDLSVQLFEETSYISNNSNISTNMEITVDRTINRAVEAIELAKENPTIENISLARMWTNLLKETINKDELHNQISNITEIKDLKIEKKSVSANVDVYVKSDNALSMTLSTNSIVFDNYSGVNDIEKLNALEVTVHSSLPYDLNAYLESGLSSSDNTTMDSNLLQIKQSENSTYQSFTNTTDKIILEEDCNSGNYNKHNIDLKIEGSNAYKADIYKATIKFEAEQK